MKVPIKVILPERYLLGPVPIEVELPVLDNQDHGNERLIMEELGRLGLLGKSGTPYVFTYHPDYGSSPTVQLFEPSIKPTHAMIYNVP